LWNIGVEGQITLGAIFTTGLLRLLQPTDLPPGMIICAEHGGRDGGRRAVGRAGRRAEGVWRRQRDLQRIGLNFVATAITLWLIFGPWKRPGVGSMSGTEPFAQSLWLPVLPGLRISVWSLLIALVGAGDRLPDPCRAPTLGCG
jgi:general nucleoside transport system permease protein